MLSAQYGAVQTSLAFGIVNFLGIVLLLYLNFMP